MSTLRVALVCTIFAGLVWPSQSQALPDLISQVGFVVDAEGMPFEGEHDIRVRFYDRRVGGELVFEEWHRQVPFIDGNYAIAIGSIEDLNPLDFLRPAIYAGISIDNNPESTPRLPILKIPVAMIADIANDVRGEINPEAIRINGNVIIDANGQWVGDPTGLVGPAGPPGADGARGPLGERGARGPQGEEGAVGPQGAAGDSGGDGNQGAQGPPGQDADPAEVVPLVIAELIRQPPADFPYVSKLNDDSKSGNLVMNGGRLILESNGVTNSLDLRNNNIVNANRLTIADPGASEGIMWNGTQASIVVTTANDGNRDGQLRLKNDDGVVLDSWAAVSGSLGVGTETPEARLDVRGAIKLGSQNDCAAANAGTIRWTGAAMEVCDGAAWTGLLDADANLADLLRDNDGAGSGLDADRLDGLNSTQFMRTDQDTGSSGSISTGGSIRITDGQMGGGDRDWMNTGVRIGGGGGDSAYFGMKVEGDNAADTVIAWGDDAGDDLRFIFAESGGAADGAERMRVTSGGQVGIGTANPRVALDVNGSIRIGTSDTCDANHVGTMRYGDGTLEVCSGAGGWVEQLNTGSDIIQQIAGGDGAGSGLDADRLDGLNSTQFMRTDTNTGSSGTISSDQSFEVTAGQMAGGNRAWMNKGLRLGGGGSDAAYFGMKVEGDNSADTVVAWGDDAGDDLRFIFAANGGAADGDERMRVLSSGQVGIGLTAPPDQLSVNGDIGLMAGSTLNLRTDAGALRGMIKASEGGQNLNIATSNGETIAFRDNGPDGDINMVIRGDGNVGVGVNDPARKLQVSTDIQANRHLLAGGDVYVNSWIPFNGNTLFMKNAGGQTQVTVNGDNGRVGIGTGNAAAGARLHVRDSDTAGSIRVGGGNGAGNSRVFIQANGERSYIDSYGDDAYKPLRIAASRLSLMQGNVGIGTDSPAAPLHVSGAIRANQYCDQNGNNCTNLTGLGSQWDDVAGGIRFTDGNVGVGMTAGEAPLQVNGNIMADNGGQLQVRTNGGNLRGMLGAIDATPHFNIATSGGEDIAFRDGNVDGDVNMFIGGRHGNVGIGSADPNSHFKLHVQGTGRTAGHTAFFHSGSDVTYLGMGAGNNSHYITQRGDGSFAIHRPSVGDRLVIADNGRVGIGTGAPGSALQVAGDVRANRFCDRNGNNCTDLSGLGSQWEDAPGGIRYNDGNVGLGMTADDERLQVDGNIQIENGNALLLKTQLGTLRGYISASEVTPHLDIATTNMEDIAFRDGGLDGDINLFIDGGTTRIGVATATPTQTLDVNGNTFIRGRVGIGHAENWHQNLSVKQGMALQGRGDDESAYLQFYLDGDHHTRFMTYGRAGWRDRVIINKDSGRVGIGTMSPSSALQVAGTVRATQFCDTDGNNCTDLTGLGGQWDPVAQGIRYLGDNVGIGVNAPSEKLQVNGNIRIDNGNALHLYTAAGNLRGYMAASEDRPWLDIATSGGEGMAFRDGGLNGDINMYINGDGEVGIGTVAPREKLQVAGNTFITGRVGIGHAENWHQSLSVKQGMALQGRGNNNGAYLQFYLDGDHHTRFMTYGAQQWQDRIIINKDNGRVGIGTMSPGSRLHVNGTIRANQICDENGNNCADVSDGLGGEESPWRPDDGGVGYSGGHAYINNGGELRLRTEADGVRGYLRASEGSPHLDLATSGGEDIALRDGGPDGDINLFIEGTNGNVGINTTTPSAKLDVRGGHAYVGDETFNNPGNWDQTINIDSDRHARVLIEERASGTQTILSAHTGGHAYVGTISNHDFGVLVRGNVRAKFKENGNVGIGVAEPDQRLAVQGNIEARSGGWFIARSGNNSNYAHIKNSSEADSVLAFHTSGERMRIQSNGNVGIGTASPEQKLHVNGDIQSQGHVRIKNERQLLLYTGANNLRGQIRASENSPHLDIATSGGEDIAFRDTGPDGDVNLFIEGTNGHVGIGTTNPTQRLHVNGNIRGVGVQVDDVQTTKMSVGNIRTAYAGRVLADRTNRREREIANFTVNDHHWSFSNGFFVEAFSRYYDSGYAKFYVESGYRSKSIRKVESRGDLVQYFGLRLEDAGVVGQRGGFPERRFRLYAQAHHYTQWEVYVHTGSFHTVHMNRDVSSDGQIAIKTGGDHRVIPSLTNNARIDTVEGNLGVGTHSPQARLHVNGTIRANELCDENGRNCVDISSGIGGGGESPWAVRGDGIHYDGGTVNVNNGRELRFRTERNVLRGQIRASEGSPHLDIATSGDENIAFRDGGIDGNINMLIHGNGNVGVGTTSPSAKLDVRGGHLYVGDESFSNPGNWDETINLDSNVHARVLIEERGTGTKTALWAHTGGNAAVGTISNHDFRIMANGEKIRVKTNGNVGIGTTSPGAKLDVRGGHLYVGDETFSNPGNWDETINLDSNVHARVLIEERDTGTQTALWAHTGGNAAVGTISNHDFRIMASGEKIRVKTNGNVGIGTTSPTYKLDVVGDVGLSRYLRHNDDGDTNLDFQNNRLTMSTGGLEMFDAANAGQDYLTLGNGGDTDVRVQGGGGSMFIQGSNGYIGFNDTTPSYPVDVNGTTNVGGNLYASGRLGVGTTNPVDKVTIVGNVTQIDGSPEWHLGTSSPTHVNWRVAAQEVVDQGFEIASGTRSAGANASGDRYTTRFTIKGNTGNVGIGTTSPSSKLDVRNGHLYVGDQTFSNPGNWDETINIDSNVHARMLIEERGTGTQTVLWAHTGGNAAVGTISNHDFKVLSNGGERMRIKTNGNIGIGTDSPDAKLDVQTNSTTLIKAQGSGNDYVNAGVLLQANDDDDYRGLGVFMQSMAGDREWYMGNPYASNDAFMISRQTGIANHTNSTADKRHAKFYMNSSGNIGLGLTNPRQKLEVNGSVLIRNANYLRLHTERDNERGAIRAVESSPHLRIQTSGGEDIGLYDGGQQNLHIEGSNGNVGIGTSSPSTKLHVNGSLKIGSSDTCNRTYAGTIRWNNNKFEGCNGTSWVRLDNSVETPRFRGLQAFWNFEGNYNDVSGNNQNGRAGGNARLQTTGIGQSVQFRGAGRANPSTSWVELTSIGDNWDALSVATWVKSGDRDHYKGVWQIVSHYSAFILGTGCWDCNTMCFIVQTNGWRYGSCHRVETPNEWHHFVGTYNRFGPNGQKKKLFVDGVLRDQNNGDRGGQAPGRIANDGGPIDLGHRECCNHGNFNGWMDEVMIYNRELSQGEISQLYDSYNGRVR